MGRIVRSSEIERLIYEAALSPEVWQDVAEAFSLAFSGSAVMVRSIPRGTGETESWSVDMVEGFPESHPENVVRWLPFSNTTVKLAEGRFAWGGDAYDGIDIGETDFYREWMAPQGLPPHWPLYAFIAEDDGALALTITLYRCEGQPAFTREDQVFANRFVPHLSRAVRMRAKLRGLQRARLALAEVIDRLPRGVLLLDAQRRLVATNRSADLILAQHDGFLLGPRGPYAVKPAENARLQQLLAQATRPAEASDGGEDAEGSLSVSRPSGRRAFTVRVSPLLAAPPSAPSGQAVAAVFIADPDAGHISATEVLEHLYELTRAEAELVRLLSRGHTLEEAAKMRGVSIHTARSHLKHAFAKTRTNRQGELIRLVLTGVAGIAQSRRPDPEDDPDDPER